MSMQPWEVQYEQGRDIDRLRKENEQMRAAIDGLNKEAVASITGLGSENERLLAALTQVREVCDDNAAATCNQAMALAFVRSVAVDALAAEQKAP